ncbi:MAG: hypothetical protein ACREMZ_08585 [Gemmatimonadales bacterium]
MTTPNTEAGTFGADGPRQQTGGSAREQIREVKDQVVGQARTTLEQARDRAGSSLGESKAQLADQFGTIAQALRRTSEQLRSEDQQRIAGLTETVARQVDQIGDYLRNRDARAMRTDLENLARRQPGLVVGSALILGLVGARFLKSSQRGRRGSRINYGREPEFSYPGAGQSFSGPGESGRRLAGAGGGYAGA